MREQKSKEFEKFSDLTKRLLSVPKKEIDKRHEEWKKNKAKKRTSKMTEQRGEKRK